MLVGEMEGRYVIKVFFLFLFNVPEIDIYISSPLSQGIDSLVYDLYHLFSGIVFFWTCYASCTNSRGEIGLEMLPREERSRKEDKTNLEQSHARETRSIYFHAHTK